MKKIRRITNGIHRYRRRTRNPNRRNRRDETIWIRFLGKDVIPENNSCELYFEERNIEAFAEKLEKLYPETRYF